MSSNGNPKRNQHFLPVHYLKGFADPTAQNYIWEYRKDLPFNRTSRNPYEQNPFHKPIKKAGRQRDIYSIKKGEQIDDTYEDEIKSLEDPAIPILNKIRHYMGHSQLTAEEKMILSRYILLMLKRVPSEQKKRMEKLWPRVVDQTEEWWKKILEDYAANTDLNDPSKLAIYEKRKEDVAKVIEESRQGMPDQIRVKAVVMQSNINFPAILSQMTWQFFVAPSGTEFFAGDTPVFFFEELGINKDISELSLPISNKVCLVASWRKVQEGYFRVENSHVETINERTAQRSERYIYASSATKAAYDLISRQKANPDQIKLLYPPYYLQRKLPRLS